MKRPIFHIDFNHMIEPDLVILSSKDGTLDASGATVLLTEGLQVTVCMDDLDENGKIDNLIANGTVEKSLASASDWSSWAKWCCRIDDDGIRPQSEIS